MDFGYRITPIFFYSKWDKDKDFQSESVIALYMTRCGSVMVSTVWTLTTAGATLRRVTLSRGQMTSGSSLSSSSASSSRSSLPSASSPWTLSSLSRLTFFLRFSLEAFAHIIAFAYKDMFKSMNYVFSSFGRSGNTSRNWRRNWGHENHLWPSTLGQVRPSWQPHLGDQDHRHQLTWRYQEPEQDMVMRWASLRVNQRRDEAARSWREYTPASESSNSGRSLQAAAFCVKHFLCFQMFWLDLLSDIFIFC